MILLTGSDSRDVLDKLEDLEDKLDQHTLPLKLSELRDLFYRGAAQVVKAREVSLLRIRRSACGD